MLLNKSTGVLQVPGVSTDVREQAVPDTHNDPSTAEQTSEASLTSPSAEEISASRSKKRRIQTSCYLTPGCQILWVW